MEGKVVCSRFQLHERIGAGTFGVVYSGTDLRTREPVAVKLESTDLRVSHLSYESEIYAILAGGVNVPQCHFYGEEGRHRVLAMELCGRSVDARFHECQHRFSLKSVLLLADQMLSAVEYVHSRHFVHCDLKPGNFVFGRGSKSNQLFLIDFGLAKKYRDPSTLEHIPYSQYNAFTGTARYASIRALHGEETSRRDDMESLAYVWVHLLRKSLPWIGLGGTDPRKKDKKILSVKRHTREEDLCADLPIEFQSYLKAVKALAFRERPPYEEYRAMFRELFLRSGFAYDYRFEWTVARPRPPMCLTPRAWAQMETGNLQARKIGSVVRNTRLVPPEPKVPKRREIAKDEKRTRQIPKALLCGAEQIIRS